jgi:hypothetical protein
MSFKDGSGKAVPLEYSMVITGISGLGPVMDLP